MTISPASTSTKKSPTSTEMSTSKDWNANPSRSRRSSAREQVAQSWATRRKQHEEQQALNPNAKITPTKKRQLQHQSNHTNSLPLCAIIRHTWDNAILGMMQKLMVNGHANAKLTTMQQLQQKQQSSSSSSVPQLIDEDLREKVKAPTPAFFPSVLNILQANELVNQLQHLQQKHVDRENDHDDEKEDNNTGSGSHIEQALLLSVLPKGYNYRQAITKMAQSRSRAFLLLDLAHIIHTIVAWKHQGLLTKVNSRGSMNTDDGAKYMKSTTSTTSSATESDETVCCTGIPSIQYLYTVHHNSDPKLLQILHRLNIGLVCTTKWDILQCQTAIIQNENSKDNAIETDNESSNTTESDEEIILYDNACVTGKPDGYYRTLIFDSNSSCYAQKAVTVAVDGPCEVQRIVSTITRVHRRRIQSSSSTRSTTNLEQPRIIIDFILRLNSNHHHHNIKCESCIDEEKVVVEEDEADWLDVLCETHKAILDEEQKLIKLKTTPVTLNLIGVSMDIKNVDEHEEHQQQIETILHQLRSFHQSNSQPKLLRIDFTNLMSSPSLHTFKWLSKISSSNSNVSITIDISYLLLSSAGALCTRIIGVKDTPSKVVNNHVNNDNNNDDGVNNNAVATTATNNNNEAIDHHDDHDLHMHYYIDDGCYGSLCNTNNYDPIPLLVGEDKQEQEQQEEQKDDDANNSKCCSNGSKSSKNNDYNYHLSTVWGPTCDGLDRVCNNIVLPKLRRDDWLIFFHNNHSSTPQSDATANTSGSNVDDDAAAADYSSTNNDQNINNSSNSIIGSQGMGTAFNGFTPPDTAYCVLNYFQ